MLPAGLPRRSWLWPAFRRRCEREKDVLSVEADALTAEMLALDVRWFQVGI